MIHNEQKRTISTNSGHEPDTGQCASEDVVSQRGWIVRSYISWRGERNIPYKGFKTMRLMVIRNGLNQTISISGGHGLLLTYYKVCLMYETFMYQFIMRNI